MTDEHELATAIAAIASALDAVGVTWAIGGSIASDAYGEPRATNHVDIMRRSTNRAATTFATSLGADFYVDADAAREAARKRASFNVIDQRSFIKVDVFVPPPGPLGAGQLDRLEKIELIAGLAPLPVLGPEDVVLQKLRWFRLGGEVSDRQWRDVVGVLGGARKLDDGYLDRVAAGEGLAPLLARARADAGR